MRKALLSCLVPILIFAASVAFILFSYRGYLHTGIVNYEIQSISTQLSAELYSKDINYVTVRDYQSSAAKALKEYNLASDKEKMKEWLSLVVDSTDCSTAVVCDPEGAGFDERGRTVNLSQKDFFNLISTGYGANSSGVIYVNDEDYGGDAIAFVNGLNFVGGSKGYLVSFLNLENLSEGLFEKQPQVSYGVWTAVKGHLLSEYGERARNNGESIQYVWDAFPENINRDRIEHALMQNVNYKAEIDGYGYIIAVPAPISGGAAMALVSYTNMERAIWGSMYSYRVMFIRMMVATLILAFILALGHYIFYAQKRRNRYDLEKDSLTGLLTKESVDIEVSAYLSEPGEKNGLLFLLEVCETKRIRKEKGDAYVDAKEIEFSRRLTEKFRASDVVGRIDEDKFVVFMKDISDPKDIRKHIDEIVVMIHDIKNSDEGKNLGVVINVGVAVAPKDGSKFSKLFNAASAALEDSKSRGAGLVAFYQG